MSFMRGPRPPSIHDSGAVAGCILCGIGGNNRGLRLRVLQDQPKGAWGPLAGRFVILDAGENKHTQSLEALVGQVTDAQEVLRVLRQVHPGCVSVTNTNLLVKEPTAAL